MKHMTHWLIVMGIVGGATAAMARAAPYWVAWEGDDFPENEGWRRVGTGSVPTRTLSNGVMTFDSLSMDQSDDIYQMNGAPDPEPGEEFVVQWRLRVNQIDWDSPLFPFDPGWSVKSAEGWKAVFVIGFDEFDSFLEDTNVAFAPGLFHDWEFRSADMRTFTINLDGTEVASGNFVSTLPGARIEWGDAVHGPTSSFDWDYFRFGVVPEPTTSLSMMTVVVMGRLRKMR